VLKFATTRVGLFMLVWPFKFKFIAWFKNLVSLKEQAILRVCITPVTYQQNDETTSPIDTTYFSLRMLSKKKTKESGDLI